MTTNAGVVRGSCPDPDWGAELQFLKSPRSYPSSPRAVSTIETSMSWVFLTDDEAFKAKKRIIYEGINFSDPKTRRQNAENEVRLNRRLAPAVYRGVSVVTRDPRGGFALDSSARPVDWLVRMRRLPADSMLDAKIQDDRLVPAEIDAAAAVLASFFAAAPRIGLPPAEYLRRMQREITRSAAEIEDIAPPELGRSAAHIAQSLERFLADEAECVGERARHLVDAHGDLRPEHVSLAPPTAIIDCLEFSAALRLRDPADELVFLGMECERLGAANVGPALINDYALASGDQPHPRLLSYYRALRSFIRARISVAHLRAPSRALPEKWITQGRTYLSIAAREVRRLRESAGSHDAQRRRRTRHSARS